MRVLVTGGAGFLGRELVGQLARRDVAVRSTWHTTPGPSVGDTIRADVTDPEAVARAVAGADVVIHTAYARVSPASWAVNVDGTAAVATACRATGARLIHLSSDVVFAGDRAPYREGDPLAPVHQYGREKAEAELVARRDGERVTVVRTTLLYDGLGGSTHEQAVLAGTDPASPIRHFTDEYRSPVHVADVAIGIVALLDHPEIDTVHLAGPQRLSRFEFALALAPRLGVDPALVRPGLAADHPDPRPRDVTMLNEVAEALLDYRPRAVAPVGDPRRR